ncbi:MAG: hypothetical protein KC933_05800 [Myxococcales bacterium]|nr:hypothetical protein [Myxococcales bacterium]MCB9651251.1 hypothetical protein [Deltaproteobacteria bacterium]
MSEPQAASKSARRLALWIMGGLIAVAVPYGFLASRTYRDFSAYVKATLDEPATPPAWRTTPLSPEGCVEAGIRWLDGCPGEAVFCEGGFRRVVRECMAVTDRGAWCDGQDKGWASTHFGYTECEAKVAAETDKMQARLQDKYCPAGYRVLADLCKARAAEAPR